MNDARNGWFAKAGALLSQALNALFCKGYTDQTISSRAWSDAPTSPGWDRARAWIDAIVGEGHCQRSWETDEYYAKQVLNKSTD